MEDQDFQEDTPKKKKKKRKIDSINWETVKPLLEQREFKRIPVGQIHPNPWNKNRMSAEYFKELKNNLENSAVSFTIPILVRVDPDGDGYQVIDGAHRLKAAQELRFEEIPCIVMPPMSDSQAKYLTLESNAIRGETKDTDLKDLLKEIEMEGLEWLGDDEFDIYKGVMVDIPVDDASKYALSDDDLQSERTLTEPITLFFSQEQAAKFRLITSQLRLIHSYTLEQAVSDVFDFYDEQTGLGKIEKES